MVFNDTADLVREVLGEPNVPFPPRAARIGATVVRWEHIDPGVAFIHAQGGTCDDRRFAEQIVKERLRAFGYERAQFDLDWIKQASPRLASWDEIMAKATRLIQSNQVTVLRNGYNNVVGHVVGDHGEYNTEFGRDDPDSRAITTWQCDCPWDQYAWGRTRKWKKYEGRPCAHVLALYWKSTATPLDDDVTDEQKSTIGPGQKMGPSGPPPEGEPLPSMGPSKFAPEGPIPAEQPSLFPGEAPVDLPQGPTQAPMAPPGESGILPPAPMEQMQQMMQPPIPGTSPAGMPAPPGAVSVPGARPPSPFNPIQYPGGTYSSTEFAPQMIVRATKPIYGLAEGKSEANGAGQYREVEEGATGEVMSQDPTTGWVEVAFPVDDAGPLEPTVVRCFCETSDIEETRIRNQSPWTKRR